MGKKENQDGEVPHTTKLAIKKSAKEKGCLWIGLD